MTPKRWLALAGLVALLLLVRDFGLYPQPEAEKERHLSHVADLPASDMVPTYIASLFMGAFRAVAIDYLWIQLKEVEEERRWYERREILKMISYFQPRNPEVWSYLGWHSAYNVANGFTDPDRAYEWIHFGLTWLRKGIQRLPNSVYLKFELARTLSHKPSWRTGQLDVPLLHRLERDAELQRLLLPEDLKKKWKPTDPPRSSFELAVIWYERARDQLFEQQANAQKTQMGLYIYTDTLDGFIREAMFYQAMYRWMEKDRAGAKLWFQRTSDHTKEMVDKSKRGVYGNAISGLHIEWVEFYGSLPKLVDLEEKAASGDPAAKRAYLDGLLEAVVRDDIGAPLDQGFLWTPNNPQAPLNRLKRESMGDSLECNDGKTIAAMVALGRDYEANLEPPGGDVDWYQILFEAPKDEHGHPEASHEGPPPEGPPEPATLGIEFTRPEETKLDFKVTVLDPLQRELKAVEARGTRRIEAPAARYGYYLIKVEPLDPKAPWPRKSTYRLKIGLGE